MWRRNGKLRAGKLVTRPTDMSEVLDLHPDAAGNGSLNEAGATSSSGQFTADALQRGEVVRHVVPGCPGAVYTFAQHAGACPTS